MRKKERKKEREGENGRERENERHLNVFLRVRACLRGCLLAPAAYLPFLLARTAVQRVARPFVRRISSVGDKKKGEG